MIQTNFYRKIILLNLQIGLILFLILYSSLAYADIYKWVDKNGSIHFTDDYLSIPEEYRNQIEIKRTFSPQNAKLESELIKSETEKAPQLEGNTEKTKPYENLLEEENIRAISILGKIMPKADKNGNIYFAGRLKNNSQDLLHSVQIVYDIMDPKGNILKSITSVVTGKKEGVLEGGEIGRFEVKTKIRIITVGSYKNKVSWKSFAK